MSRAIGDHQLIVIGLGDGQGRLSPARRRAWDGVSRPLLPDIERCFGEKGAIDTPG
ncbi:hypothetical protein [Thermacetogenium phaeum]|uniref:hypothetical protein n=1 Tax=Thermacetogenium phaeum TaxID=85874 RepID=UPI0012DF1584|nr:hypothetical protein [Thermacetogenium phaeum]